MPLGLSVIERDVKLFLLDSGLLISCYGIETQKAFLQNKIGNNKGAIYENVFAVILKSKDYPIYFFQKQFNATKEYSNFEIDFVIFKDNKINLIECKSSNSTAKSLNKVISFNKKCVGYKFVNGGFGFNENIKTLPLYMVYYLF
jgi:predicted AAA+ superfamily ATPase